MGLSDALNESQRPRGATGLASSTGGDKLLIGISILVSSVGSRHSPFLIHILRPLAATHVVIETAYETYAAGPVSKASPTQRY